MKTSMIQSELWINIHLRACIRMTMLRPEGQAFKIAAKVIPGFNKNRSVKRAPSKGLPKDNVELKITHINEQRGYAHG